MQKTQDEQEVVSIGNYKFTRRGDDFFYQGRQILTRDSGRFEGKRYLPNTVHCKKCGELIELEAPVSFQGGLPISIGKARATPTGSAIPPKTGATDWKHVRCPKKSEPHASAAPAKPVGIESDATPVHGYNAYNNFTQSGDAFFFKGSPILGKPNKFRGQDVISNYVLLGQPCHVCKKEVPVISSVQFKDGKPWLVYGSKSEIGRPVKPKSSLWAHNHCLDGGKPPLDVKKTKSDQVPAICGKVHKDLELPNADRKLLISELLISGSEELAVSMLRLWDWEKIERFALHLLGPDYRSYEEGVQAGREETLNQIPEGCTASDVKILREANTQFAQDNFELIEKAERLQSLVTDLVSAEEIPGQSDSLRPIIKRMKEMALDSTVNSEVYRGAAYLFFLTMEGDSAEVVEGGENEAVEAK